MFGYVEPLHRYKWHFTAGFCSPSGTVTDRYEGRGSSGSLLLDIFVGIVEMKRSGCSIFSREDLLSKSERVGALSERKQTFPVHAKSYFNLR